MSTKDVKAKGSGINLAFIEETTENEVPTTGTVYELKCGAETFDAALPTEFDSDISRTGGKSGTIRGLETLSGGFTAQAESGAYDAFIRSLLRRKAFTTDTLSGVATAATGSVDGKTCTITGTNMENLIVGLTVKFTGFSDSTMNDIFRVISTSATSLVIGIVTKDQDFTGIALTTQTATIVQTYAKNQGDERVSFTVEKRVGQINTTGGFPRLKGVQTNSATFTGAAGSAPTIAFDFKGISDEVANDGMVGPSNWVIDGAGTAGDSTVTVKDGTTTPQAGDKFFIEGDTSNTEYTVESIATLTITIDPVLGADISDSDKTFFERPATDGGTGQKMENNLGFLDVDGESICSSSTTITITPNLQEINCMGDENAVELAAGDRSVTGTIVPYFSTKIQPLLAKIRAFTRFPITLFMRDKDNNMICVLIPQAVADKELLKRSDNMAVPQNIPFKAEESTTYGTNAIISVLTA